MCRSHVMYGVHGVHGVHGVQPPSKSHTRTVTAPCRWHVNRQRGRREGGRREGGSSLIPSIAHPAGTHHPSSPSHTLPLFSSLSFTPTIHAHIITSTDLSDNHQHTTAPLTHTHTSQTSPVACASAQRKHSSSSSSSPTTRVPRHHHQPISSSTCMQHL